MPAIHTLASLEEYLSHTYEPDCEYIHGELIQRNVGTPDHGNLQMRIAAWFHNHRKELGCHALTETRLKVASQKYRIPDVCVVLGELVRGVDALTAPPFLCVEVLSPDDRVSEIEEKIEDYLQMGVPFVWVADPRRVKGYTRIANGRREELITENPAVALTVAELLED